MKPYSRIARGNPSPATRGGRATLGSLAAALRLVRFLEGRRRGVKATALAGVAGASLRQTYRYLGALSEAGWPVENSEAGFWRLAKTT